MSKLTLIDYEKKKREYLLTVKETSNYLFFKTEKTFKVRGGCTVWHYYPSGNRCSTSYEFVLSNFWQTIKWKEEDSK